MDTRAPNGNSLGTFLRDRRAKLDPAALGFVTARRRTPGLRREEVAQRANVSATWYTWLEQGRSGAPSAGALERIAHALMMTDAEREHLFLLGLDRPPEVRYQRTKHIRRGRAGPITLDYSSFAVDGRPDLGLVIFTPATPADAKRVRKLIDSTTKRPVRVAATV